MIMHDNIRALFGNTQRHRPSQPFRRSRHKRHAPSQRTTRFFVLVDHHLRPETVAHSCRTGILAYPLSIRRKLFTGKTGTPVLPYNHHIQEDECTSISWPSPLTPTMSNSPAAARC